MENNSKNYRRPGQIAIFLLNNYSYVANCCKGHVFHEELGDKYITKYDKLIKNIKENYLDWYLSPFPFMHGNNRGLSWTALTQHLTEIQLGRPITTQKGALSASERHIFKDRFRVFNLPCLTYGG